MIRPRPRPCSSCPYRRDAPSGLWAASEYAKLLRYDGTIAEQAQAGALGLFFCHHDDGQLCAGWVGCHDMRENLALRMVALDQDIDLEAVLNYRCPVPLFGSGQEAAEHGLRDLEAPSPAVRRKAEALRLLQARRALQRLQERWRQG